MSWQAVFKPFSDLRKVVVEARGVVFLSSVLLACFVGQVVLPSGVVNSLVMRAGDLFSASFYTVFTSSFLHGSVSHLVSNVVVLIIFGRVVERYFGETTLYATYVIGVVVGGSLTQLVHVLNGSEWSAIGASIGVSTVIAVAVLRSPWYLTYFLIVPLPIAMVAVVYIWQESVNLFAADGVSHLGHLLGVTTGVGIGFVTDGLSKTWSRIGLVVLVALAGIVLFFGLS